jgi:hypothetical protein
MTDHYTITFSPQGLAFVRQLLGQRPHDEVRAFIDNLDAQRAEQDAAPAERPERLHLIDDDGKAAAAPPG